MGRPYSQDLRERVVDAAGTTSHRQAAARFGVGVATAIRWMAALMTTGTVAPRPQGRARRSKLDPHEAYLRGLIAERTDITLEEMRTRVEKGPLCVAEPRSVSRPYANDRRPRLRLSRFVFRTHKAVGFMRLEKPSLF